ncbi:hypothetical protein A3K91_2055 [Psychrobacter alimentarius]|uniref:Uncharacterized protein n=1 Tax=Psychrobacter alimentarius TaxID=261164 RepID=A0ABN4N5W6_9GAMM|nr:hypothetical protein A3K91_2055 [Psychrobacter alimentarius]
MTFYNDIFRLTKLLVMWYMMVKVVRKTGVAVIIMAAVFAYSEYSIKWVHVIATRDCYKFLLLAVPMPLDATKNLYQPR